MDHGPPSGISETYTAPINIPGGDGDTLLGPPRAPYATQSELASPRSSYLQSQSTTDNTPNNSSPLLAPADKVEAEQYAHGTDMYTARPTAPKPWYKQRRWIVAGVTTGLVLLILAIILPIVFTVIIKPHHDTGSGSSASSSSSSTAGDGPVGTGSGNPQSPTGATSGQHDTNTVLIILLEF